MTGSVAGTDYGCKAFPITAQNTQQLHVMAGAYRDTVTVSAANEFTWGKPNTSAARMRAWQGILDKLEYSATRRQRHVRLECHARRVSFFFANTTASSANTNVFDVDQAVNWAVSVPPCTSTEANVCRERLALETNANLYHYRTYRLSAYNPLVTKAVIVIHGTERNPLAAFNQIVTAAKATSNIDNTIIISPHFPIQEDARQHGSYMEF